MIQTSIHHHLVNAALTKCRLKRKIGTYPIHLPVRASSSDLATLQGSPQKHMGTETPLSRGNESKAFLVALHFLELYPHEMAGQGEYI